ncbi:MAG: mechanosensitive ion channel family protein [Desulfotomaculaceae bacterium]|nr:mechanosensitive ion channel family protein [Desulfotomaculaceae bacterium]
MEMFLAGIKEWFAPGVLQNLLGDLILSLAVLISTYILIKIFSCIIDRLLREGRIDGGEQAAEKGAISGSFVRSVRILLQTLLLYGGYFIAAIIVLDVFDFKIVSSDQLKFLGVKTIQIVGVVVGAKLIINLGQLAVKQFFEKHKQEEDNENFTENRRTETLKKLLLSVITYIIFFIAFIMVLQIFNVNTSAILASAGILGLAVGFGAQNLVKDVISGFFILFENQFNVGEYVVIDEVEGTVEEIGLRTCKIRQWTGQLNIIPNGEITRVTNYNRGPMLALVIVGIAYEEDIDQAIAVLRQECEAAFREIKAIIDLPQVLGVTDLNDSSVNICVVAPSVPGEYWGVERELRRRFKNVLDRAGIEIPYPRRVLYQRNGGNNKEK